MTTRKPPRKNEDETPDTAMASPGSKPARIEFGLMPQSPYLAVMLIDLDKTGLIDGNQQDGYFLTILPGDHWLITFTLNNAWHWTFDTDPISFKTAAHAKNYKLVSQSPRQVVIEASSPYPKHISPNPWPKAEEQPFNLYVLMEQSNKKTYAMTIDPDVKNPPLGGNRMGPITAMAVPIG